ncbi:NAD(P)H-binding protein [Actinomycetospora chibensis]|uniref:NAD(P)H-binding protein n=1 Tax=Actinomycetospora chibensis TaxID=663606 RepID=A0ABV9RQC1_9PSEU|nr:NAD(P)H-binding protein [Actinomycetospora chibensis]MDD7925310.1 NAD(P)H-binding protein [Actinomycetospora chibensis]
MILVTGARGHVGRAVLDGLLAAGVPADRLRASGRDPSVLGVPAGIITVAADLADPSTLPAAFDGVEQAFLYASGDGSLVAEAARAAGVAHVVLLSSLSVLDDDPEDRIGAMHRGAEAPWHDAGVTATFLRPGAFATNTLDWADGVRAGLVELPCPDSHVTPIHEADIADVAVAALTGGAVRGTAPSLTGPESLSFREQVGVIAAEVGREVEVAGLSADDYRERMGRFAPPWVADTLLRLWSASDGRPQPVDDVAPLLGAPGRSFATWVRDHLDAFV